MLGLSEKQRIEFLGIMERTRRKEACDLRGECLSLQCQEWENVPSVSGWFFMGG